MEDGPQGGNGKVDLADFVARGQGRVVRSTFSAILNGLVASV